MTLARIVSAETLDNLAENDPTAMRSRRDLRRVHFVMATQSIILRALHNLMSSRTKIAPLRILELGAGDGSLMLGVAKKLAATWPKVELTLLDRQIVVNSETIASYAKLGWTAKVETIDVLDWANSAIDPLYTNQASKYYDVILANLFLHHFESGQLATLMNAIASRCDQFLACEPRRSWFALAGSHLVVLLGANKVTREDAVLSVHAGFCANELSIMWPDVESMTNQHSISTWQVLEYSAGLFSHCFCADKLKVYG
jgi:hypothetical protein